VYSVVKANEVCGRRVEVKSRCRRWSPPVETTSNFTGIPAKSG
jgi:hypothetical protein